jgi:hypothetical protein
MVYFSLPKLVLFDKRTAQIGGASAVQPLGEGFVPVVDVR